MSSITPLQAVKLAENSNKLTIKERQKLLALSLTRMCDTVVKMDVMWRFSMLIIKMNFQQDIGEFDSSFVVDINKNPSKYVDYV